MTRKPACRAASVIAAALVVLLAGSGRSQCQTLSISIPALRIATSERIIGFEVRVRSGRIAQLPKVPIGWYVSVDNDPSWNTTVSGSIAVGAAALNSSFFQRFLVVETERDAPSGVPFELEGEVIVTSDFVAQRRIKLSMNDFMTKPI